MRSKHYAWWGYVKEIIRAYPSQIGVELCGVEQMDFKAVDAAIDETVLVEDDGDDRIKLISLVHWTRNLTIDGAAMALNISRRTALRMQRNFFETVARNRGLLD